MLVFQAVTVFLAVNVATEDLCHKPPTWEIGISASVAASGKPKGTATNLVDLES